MCHRRMQRMHLRGAAAHRVGDDIGTRPHRGSQVGHTISFQGIDAYGRDALPQKRLTDALQPIRVSGYDQRPYKTLAVGTGQPPSGRQIVYVISHVDVTPNPQVPVLLRQLAEASRKEPGNLRFDVLLHTMRGNHFTVIEAWRNQQALDAHVAAAQTKQYRDTLQPLTGSPLDERTFRIAD